MMVKSGRAMKCMDDVERLVCTRMRCVWTEYRAIRLAVTMLAAACSASE